MKAPKTDIALNAPKVCDHWQSSFFSDSICLM